MQGSLARSVGITVLFFIAACASTTSTTKQPADVDLQLEQLPDAGFAVEDRGGAVSVAYQMSIRNRRSDAITLRKVEMQILGSAPYTLRDTPATMSETIEAGAEAAVTFTMWSYRKEQRSSAKKVVWVSGVAHFDSAQGPLRREFTLSFREP